MEFHVSTPADDRRNAFTYTIRDADGWGVAEIPGWPNDPDYVARLFASAPDLLRLVKTMDSYIATMKAAGLIAGEPWMSEIRPILDRIAK
jgi:hypothetical protein